MKKKRTCPTCGATLDADAEFCANCEQEFCPACQAPLAEMATRCQACGAEFDLICPECEEVVPANAATCPQCGFVFAQEAAVAESSVYMAPVAVALGASAPTVSVGNMPGSVQEDVLCPNCEAPVSLMEGFCRECGQMFCTRCNQAVDEDDEICPHCQTALFFDCPICDFELTAGTEICPNCNTLFPNYCANCRQPVQPGDRFCLYCEAQVTLIQRKSARVVHAIRSGERVVQIVACPECGEQFNAGISQCPRCSFRLCPNCQIHLEAAEKVCPRCGEDPAEVAAVAAGPRCPTCGLPVTVGSDECPHCQQLLCPECLAPVAEDDTFCLQCGSEFELCCPECEAIVAADAGICPQCGFTF